MLEIWMLILKRGTPRNPMTVAVGENRIGIPPPHNHIHIILQALKKKLSLKMN